MGLRDGKKMLFGCLARIYISFCLILFIVVDARGSYTSRDVTDRIEWLGNPVAEYYRSKEMLYARNVWDMIGFKDKLYFAAGNSSNSGPSVYPPPAPIFVYDPKNSAFSTAFITGEEQVDSFHLIEDILLVPGHDPKESWDFGNIYLSGDGLHWKKKRTIPGAIHVYSLHNFRDRLSGFKLFAALGTSKGAVAAVSEDFGDSWNLSLPQKGIGRFYDFLHVNGKLYVVGTIVENSYRLDVEAKSGLAIEELFEYTEIAGFVHRTDINSKVLFPTTDFPEKSVLKIVRTQSVGTKCAYIGSYVHNDHQSIPFGLYVAESLARGKIRIDRVNLPEGATPWDTYVHNGYMYVLTNTLSSGSIVKTAVLRSRDLQQWEELFFFSPPGLIRSFAILERSFYFSLGSEVSEDDKWPIKRLNPQTGSLFRVDASEEMLQ